MFGESVFVYVTLYAIGAVVVLLWGNMILELLHSRTLLLPAGPLLLYLAIQFLESNHSMAASLITTRNEVPYVWASVVSGACIATLTLLSLSFTSLGVTGVILSAGVVQLCYNNWKWPLVVCRELGLAAPEPDLAEWRAMVERMRSPRRRVRIGLVGKYVKLHDAYLSVAEALRHAAWAQDARVDIDWIDAEELERPDGTELLRELDGIIVPGGFGCRGTEGMFAAARYARENHVPYFGICLGMQVAVIEFARDAAGLEGANSGEFDPGSPHRVIDFMPGQSESVDKGGTLRLGGYPCVIADGTTLYRCYGERVITERHRHRYEFNNDYRETLQAKGLCLSGLSPDGRLVEAVELTGERFFVGVQFHPEFKSRPNRPHPLFAAFTRAALERAEGLT